MKPLLITVLICVVLAGSMLAARHVHGDEVIDNAIMAHKKLMRLRVAVLIYMNDNGEHLDDPQHLFPTYVTDPLMFWHPGDNDPAPLTINNSLPNTRDSAQVSFLFHTGDVGGLQGDDYMIWDASPANNKGRFISTITADGTIETIPPFQVPVPTKITIARRRLAEIGASLQVYLNDSNGWLPQDLTVLYPDWIRSPKRYWNPGDSDPEPTDITNAVPNAPNSAHISFDFPAAGLHEDQLTPETILVQDNSAANNAGLGISIFRYDGTFEFQLVGIAGDANGDERIDLADWAKLQRCFQEWNYFDLVEDDTCRIFDFNSDDRVTSTDHDAFIPVMTGPALR
jgi:hypothetical protein